VEAEKKAQAKKDAQAKKKGQAKQTTQAKQGANSTAPVSGKAAKPAAEPKATQGAPKKAVESANQTAPDKNKTQKTAKQTVAPKVAANPAPKNVEASKKSPNITVTQPKAAAKNAQAEISPEEKLSATKKRIQMNRIKHQNEMDAKKRLLADLKKNGGMAQKKDMVKNPKSYYMQKYSRVHAAMMKTKDQYPETKGVISCMAKIYNGSQTDNPEQVAEKLDNLSRAIDKASDATKSKNMKKYLGILKGVCEEHKQDAAKPMYYIMKEKKASVSK
jgi:hypothetical protein